MLRLYSMQRSGNCYKVRLALAELGIAYENIEINVLRGETHTPDFLSKNPNGQIPLLEIAPDHYLAESNAILWYLAEGSRLLSDDPLQRALVLQWLFFEQHAIVPNIGAAYFWLCLVKGGRELQRHTIDDWMEEGQRALGVLDRHLSTHRYITGETYSIADIALYAYTHLAEQCDFDLDSFPAVREWLARVAAMPNHVGMTSANEPIAIAAK